jgi:hypothetical protein
MTPRDPHRRPNRIGALLLPNCHETSHLVSQALDGSMPWWRRPGLLLHILFCRFCRRFNRQAHWLRRFARVESVPVCLSEKSRLRLKATLRAQHPGH